MSRLLRMASALLLLLSLLIAVGGPAQAATASPINHVVVIYLENHSFDNLYGLFPGANGIAKAGAKATEGEGTWLTGPISAFFAASMLAEKC